MKIPFLFAVRAHDGDDTPDANPIVKWVVMLAQWDYATYNARWMCDPYLSDYPLVPNVDWVDKPESEIWTFTDEDAALEKMRELWSRVAVT